MTTFYTQEKKHCHISRVYTTKSPNIQTSRGSSWGEPFVVYFPGFSDSKTTIHATPSFWRVIGNQLGSHLRPSPGPHSTPPARHQRTQPQRAGTSGSVFTQCVSRRSPDGSCKQICSFRPRDTRGPNRSVWAAVRAVPAPS